MNPSCESKLLLVTTAEGLRTVTSVMSFQKSEISKTLLTGFVRRLVKSLSQESRHINNSGPDCVKSMWVFMDSFGRQAASKSKDQHGNHLSAFMLDYKINTSLHFLTLCELFERILFRTKWMFFSFLLVRQKKIL